MRRCRRALFTHAWRAVAGAQGAKLAGDHRPAGPSSSPTSCAPTSSAPTPAAAPASLKAAIGGAHGGIFDFDAMSRLLTKAAPKAAMPAAAPARIEAAARRCCKRSASSAVAGTPRHARAGVHLRLRRAAPRAVAAYRERLPESGRARQGDRHGRARDQGRVRRSRARRLLRRPTAATGSIRRSCALFPDYLVCVDAAALDAAESATLLELLVGRPADEGPGRRPTTSSRSRRSATGISRFGATQPAARQHGDRPGRGVRAAVGRSNLCQMRERIERGLAYRRAGAVQRLLRRDRDRRRPAAVPRSPRPRWSRARFRRSPSTRPRAPTGRRASICPTNPQTERDWPVHDFTYETTEHQRAGEEVAFTLVDFVACDRRYARHFARVPRADWNAKMVPVGESLAREPKGLPRRIPYAADGRRRQRAAEGASSTTS